ncbi:hypothetical protein IV498_17840 [Paenarthrobacter sp. Z7-10]|uniref:hypothetical protein n=1 Tax=Paenarthrobacter sp. Z7-10 TaxID=2787635 RepID=UPI0022A964FC|nr:hypothetical protein [Paenarthrobacter sp. Z7-10]MCZ2404972.1 hypothetical protein [Paenarthrobacter sp. Z7-10]
MQSLRLADAQTAADLRTYVTRARKADDGAIRLQASGSILAAYVCVLRPRSTAERIPTVLGLRTMNLASPAEVDVTVPLAAVADRLARLDDSELELTLPPVTVHESWAGIGAPRGGWVRLCEIGTDTLIQVAKDGVREIAQMVPINAGSPVVGNARAAVWGRPIPELGSDPSAAAGVELCAGAAFAAFALGFVVPGSSGALFQSGRWLRLSTGAGHILVRSPLLL